MGKKRAWCHLYNCFHSQQLFTYVHYLTFSCVCRSGIEINDVNRKLDLGNIHQGKEGLAHTTECKEPGF